MRTWQSSSNSEGMKVTAMDAAMQDSLLFFERHQAAYPLYERFHDELLSRFPESRIKVQKSQISYYIGASMPACPS